MRSRFAKSLVALALLTLLAPNGALAQFPPAPGTGPGLAETIEAIDSARVTTRILYITAHPDDESGAVLTYLARGLHADVALLSLTRGEGGQNALGPEQAPQLGLIRTQELLAATRGYGVKLYFTRAKDFGYSKTPEETMKVWGDQVLEDMVRVIREFRPNIVINNWGGVHSGHGHHQAAGLLTPKAVAVAADKSFCTDCGTEWKAGQILDLERGSEKPTGYVLPLDEVSPLWGKSWREIGIDAFSNHRTQGIAGFLGSPFLRRPIGLLREDGQPFDPKSLATPLRILLGDGSSQFCRSHEEWCNRLISADDKIMSARAAALRLDWPSAVNLLSEAETTIIGGFPPEKVSVIDTVGAPGYLNLNAELDRISRAVELASGFDFRASSDRGNIVPGEPFTVTVTYHCRPGVECPVRGAAMVSHAASAGKNGIGDPINGLKFAVTVPSGPSAALHRNESSRKPEPSSAVEASIEFGKDPSRNYPVSIPVTFTAATSTSVQRVPLRLVPAYAISTEPTRMIDVLAKKRAHFDVFLRVHSYSSEAAPVTTGLDAPRGWTVSAPVKLEFSGVGDKYAKFTVTPPANLSAGSYTLTAYAQRGGERFTTSLDPLPSLPTQLWEEPAQVIVHAFDINVPENLHVGYISAESEPIPGALKRLGIQVEMLDANALNFSDLGKFDAIVVGVRAYELRAELPGANQRLLDYVSGGGTLVVQYQRDFAWDGKSYAPYPAKIGSPTPRITDENAEVKFLNPNDALLNRPNKITDADFSGWIQERGLYFWSEFDSKYTPLLAMHDPGEPDLNGGLVYARLGKGVYLYTGLAFFRQLPEGVPGAYRLFVNLLSASRAR